MSPRPYRRQTQASNETRSRIIDAARELLAADSFAAFTIDAVAQLADVARMTVYYQFGSKPALLEALYDDLAARGHMERLPSAFARSDALEALDAIIDVLAGFWAADRPVLRRLRALSALDPEIDEGTSARNDRRRSGLSVILDRLAEEEGREANDLEEQIDVLFTLTSFETFDALARAGRGAADVATIVKRLARAALGGAGG